MHHESKQTHSCFRDVQNSTTLTIIPRSFDVRTDPFICPCISIRRFHPVSVTASLPLSLSPLLAPSRHTPPAGVALQDPRKNASRTP